MPFDPDLRRPDRHPLFTLLALNALAGTIAAVVVVAGLLYLDIGRLGSLIARSEAPALPVALITFGFVITLASAAMGTAIMRLGSEDDQAGGHGKPVRIPVRARKPLR
jgi:hypothetical protein